MVRYLVALALIALCVQAKAQTSLSANGDWQAFLTAGEESHEVIFYRDGQRASRIRIEASFRRPAVTAISFDGAYFVTSTDNSILLLDRSKGSVLPLPNLKGVSLRKMVFSPDGKSLFILTQEKEPLLARYDIQPKHFTRLARFPVLVADLAVSGNGRLAVSAGAWFMLLSADGTLIKRYAYAVPSVAHTLSFANSGKLMAITGKNSKTGKFFLYLTNLETGGSRMLLKGQVRSIAHPVFSPLDRWMAVKRDSNNVDIVSAASGSVRASLRGESQVVSMAFEPSGEQLLAADRTGAIIHWDILGKRISRLDLNPVRGY